MTFETTPSGSTADAVAMTIDSSQNVGIGITAPTNPLHVVGKIYSTTTAQGGTAVMTTNSGFATFGSNASTEGIALVLDCDASSGANGLFVSASSGNVGIGTSSPSYGLDVLYGTKETKFQVRNGGIYTYSQHNGGTPAFHIVDSDSDASR